MPAITWGWLLGALLFKRSLGETNVCYAAGQPFPYPPHTVIGSTLVNGKGSQEVKGITDVSSMPQVHLGTVISQGGCTDREVVQRSTWINMQYAHLPSHKVNRIIVDINPGYSKFLKETIRGSDDSLNYEHIGVQRSFYATTAMERLILSAGNEGILIWMSPGNIYHPSYAYHLSSAVYSLRENRDVIGVSFCRGGSMTYIDADGAILIDQNLPITKGGCRTNVKGETDLPSYKPPRCEWALDLRKFHEKRCRYQPKESPKSVRDLFVCHPETEKPAIAEFRVLEGEGPLIMHFADTPKIPQLSTMKNEKNLENVKRECPTASYRLFQYNTLQAMLRPLCIQGQPIAVPNPKKSPHEAWIQAIKKMPTN
ncbi:hypothetical protein AAMO2058_000966100 [Amorphochlora amoebiformis]